MSEAEIQAQRDPSGPDRLKRRYSPDPARRRAKLSETIAAQILDEITSKKLGPGEPLRGEAAMLEMYDGGRASLREALRILQASGFITIKPGPHGGTSVGSVDPVAFGRTASRYFQMSGATIGDLIGVRIILEPAAAALAAERRSEADMGALRRWMDQQEGIDLSDDTAFTVAAHDLHSMLLTMSGNRVLDLIALSVKDVFNSRIRSAMYPVRARRRGHEEHQRLADLVLAGRASEAREVMREHLEAFAAYAARRRPGLLDEVVSWQ